MLSTYAYFCTKKYIMQYTITNNYLTVAADTHGAELQSIRNNRTGHEYLWQGDKTFWNRRSPVLFPFVGAVWQSQFRCDGHIYPMSQHGFARDMEFTPMEDKCTDSELWFNAESTDETFAKYPFRWKLEIGYILHETQLEVIWNVTNLSDSVMPFQIGAHPAFNYPDFNASDDIHAYFDLGKYNNVTYELIAEDGCLGNVKHLLCFDRDNLLPLGPQTFDRDALVIGDSQITRVSMLTKEHTPYLTLLFHAPVVGLWSKPHLPTPFVCIEPWWGRCDRVKFDGTLSEREYINTLESGGKFSAGYRILIDNI